MTFTGVIIALDLAGNCGIAEGCAGEKPLLSTERFTREGDGILDAPARGIGFIANRLAAERWIDGKLYGRGEAMEAGLVRLAIEEPIPTVARGAQAFGATMRLIGAVGGFANRRDVMVRLVASQTVRARFLGKGNLRREEAKAEARRVCTALGWEPKSDDAADAGALWWFVCHQWAPDRVQPVRHLHRNWKGEQGRAGA